MVTMDPTLLSTLNIVLTIAGSCTWIPQIHKIFMSKSGEGLNLVMLSIVDAITSVVAMYCYKLGLPYSNWVEVAVTNLQLALIHGMALYYLGKHNKLAVLMFVKGCYIGCLYQLEPSQLQLILSVVFPVVILARMYESYNIYKKKSTGQMALATLVIGLCLFAGRSVTTLLSGAGYALLAPQLTHTFFSSILVIQYFLYNKSGVEEKKEEKKDEEKKEEEKKEE